eukprot:364228-Chlamydomonas_euryale.AAC.24
MIAAAPAAKCAGTIQVPLPYPATAQTVQPVPRDKLQADALPLEGAFRVNTALRDRAVHLFGGSVSGAESVVPGPGPSSVTMADRFGYIWVADAMPGNDHAGGYVLRPTHVAYVGPGRPLGMKYDATGNLVICNSLQASVAQSRRCRRQGAGCVGTPACHLEEHNNFFSATIMHP